MHRRCRSLCLLLALAGCEDGPNQVYQPSPPNAGNVWNDGMPDGGVVDPVTQDFTGIEGGNNKQEICTGDQKAMRWAAMVMEPMVPPTTGAGLDISGMGWKGLTIEQAEKINCQSDSLGDDYGDGDQTNAWGDSQEVLVEYQVSNRKITHISFNPGYVGKLKFKSADGMHNYVIQIGSPIYRDGKSMTLDWVSNGGQTFIAVADEIYRGMMATFAPAVPAEDPGVTCFDTGACTKGNFGDAAFFGVQPLGWFFGVDSQSAPQPTPSIVSNIDQYLAKVLPFSFASSMLKLDAEGPVASAGKLGKATSACSLKMGMTYSDFLANCVQVNHDAAKDQTELDMLLGGIDHERERFTFDVQGVDINFKYVGLAPTAIISDKDLPHPSDIAVEMGVDQSTLGVISNDHDNTGKLDLHGSGAVYKEYARLVRERLLALKGITDGPITNCLYPNPLPDPFDPKVFKTKLPKYCTGFEGMITAAPPTAAGDPVNLGMDATKVSSALKLGLKLGHASAAFCWDATGDLTTDGAGNLVNGYQDCDQGDMFSTSFARVLAVFGKGSTANLPSDAQDVRFFFKMYSTALIKYLTVAGQGTPPDLSTVKLDADSLFFDSQGAGQFEIVEYIDRRYAKKGATAADDVPPTDFTFEADVKNGIFNSYDFSHTLLRGETALYNAMLTSATDAPGQEDDALLSNMFGSPVLRNGWTQSSKGKSAYYCATTLDPDNCDSMTPPLDANGAPLLDDQMRPILAPYRGAFEGASTVFQLGPTKIKVSKTYPGIASALVSVPLPVDPYNAAGAGLKPMSVLVPWSPKQPGEGFPVALTSTLDKFISTAQMDFSGETITANVDYDAVIDPNTGLPMSDGTIQLLAVESSDFLGDVFLCQDDATGDLLSVRMYSPVADVLQWIDAHPSVTDSCGLIVRYSPYNNFVDYITSLTNGVRLGITQGGGFGRVVDVTLFVPGQ
jgi:hypothetical protein